MASMERVNTEATGAFDRGGSSSSISGIPEAAPAPAPTPTPVAGTHHPGVEGVGGDKTNDIWFEHSSAKRINTDVVIAQSLRAQYPGLQLTIATNSNGLNLLRYAQAGHATYRPIVENLASTGNSSGNSSSENQEAADETTSSNGVFSPVSWTVYFPPRRRIDGDPGSLGEQLNFGKFEYSWRGHDFLLYIVDGRDGTSPYGVTRNHYVLSTERKHADALLLAAGSWANELHGEVWVFDQGYWQKSAELFRSILSAKWDNVILDAGMKKAIIEDHLSFFDSRETYARLKVPWKRGIIYHGPPGNGKTISIKATMHMLYERKYPIPTLYVRSLVSYAGPEFALAQIFQKARQFAPCYLVFEDLDSIVSDRVRSYFLNEVDGLKANDGIFMIGSTNHLDRLDPGISKRPSRFDRKYYFPDPDLEQRIAYCKFWQGKLADNEDIKFPDELCKAIAKITDKFSFAYMQEAFVAALLAIARRSTTTETEMEMLCSGRHGRNSNSEEIPLTRDVGDDGWLDVCAVDAGECEGGGEGEGDDDDLDDLVLWVEIKKQIELLRQGLEDEQSRRQ